VRLNAIAVTAAHLRLGVTASEDKVALCASHPAAGQRLLAGLTWVPAVAARNAAEAGLAVIVVPLLITCGLLTLARVIRAGAQMSDDLAGTV
jgi:hypothetical protein